MVDGPDGAPCHLNIMDSEHRGSTLNTSHDAGGGGRVAFGWFLDAEDASDHAFARDG